MIAALILVVAYAAGVDPRRLVLLAGAVYLPMALAGLLAIHWYRGRSDESNRPSLFCESVSAELRAGATLRDALAAAAISVGCEPIPPASHMAEVAAHVSRCFPNIGDELRLIVVAAARTGSDAAGLFDEIGSLALAQSEISREVRVSTAPGRATALVLVGAPLVYVVGRLGSGGISEFLASSQQRLVALLGLGMFLLGLTVACLVLWSASR